MSAHASLPAWLAALVGVAILPWHMPNDEQSLTGLLAFASPDADAASALWQAIAHQRWWFWPIFAGVAAIGAALLLAGARALIALASLTLACFVLQGAAIGVRGWRYVLFESIFGEFSDRQLGMGLGAGVTLVALLLLLADGLARAGCFRGDRFVSGAVTLLVAAVTIFAAWPVLNILAYVVAPRGDLVGLAAFADRLFDAKIWGLGCVTNRVSCGVFWNTLVLATTTATAAVTIGLAFALIVTRTGFPLKRAMRLLTILPIVTPPFIVGLGLILIFGRSGVANQVIEAATGLQPGRWLYGMNGVWLAQAFSFTPTAFLVLIGVVEGISPTMEEAASTLRADAARTFRTITLPLILPGLANAWLVVFVESLADFGNPLVLGGSFGVLSTEVFYSIVGAQQDFGRAGALALILLALALGAFCLQRRVLGARSYVSVFGKGDGGLKRALPTFARRAAFVVALPWAILTVVVYVMALAGGFVRIWGRDWTPTLDHFRRAFAIEYGRDGALILAGQAWSSLLTTITLASVAAPITAAMGLVAAWLLSRQAFRGRAALEFALMVTFAVPGTVIGVAYILAYNAPPLEITGTAFILVACFVFRNLPVGVRSGVAAMSQIDRSLDEAAATLRASAFRALTTIVLPLLKPAIVTALVYSFVRAMTTVSAVVFLVSAEYEMATVFVINRVINGDYGIAIATCAVLIALMTIVIALVQRLVGERRLGRRTVAPAPLPGGAAA